MHRLCKSNLLRTLCLWSHKQTSVAATAGRFTSSYYGTPKHAKRNPGPVPLTFVVGMHCARDYLRKQSHFVNWRQTSEEGGWLYQAPVVYLVHSAVCALVLLRVVTSSAVEIGAGVSVAAAVVWVNCYPMRTGTWGGWGWLLSPCVALILVRVWGTFFGHRIHQSSVSQSWRKDL